MSSKLEKAENNLYNIHQYGIAAENFVIYLQGIEDSPQEEFVDSGIEFRTANRFIKNLDMLINFNPEKPIIVSMKISGGDIMEGLAIYDAILAAPNPVSIISYAYVESMSSVIFQAANKKIMMPHSGFMFHEGSRSVEGTAKEVYNQIKFYRIIDEKITQIYIDSLKRSQGKMKNWSKKRIREWLVDQMNKKTDVYLTAKEAVKIGFADEIFTSWESVTQYTNEQLARK